VREQVGALGEAREQKRASVGVQGEGEGDKNIIGE